jgi:hypothetical protein
MYYITTKERIPSYFDLSFFFLSIILERILYLKEIREESGVAFLSFITLRVAQVKFSHIMK